MVDHEVLDSQLKTDRFPFPSEGDITPPPRVARDSWCLPLSLSRGTLLRRSPCASRAAAKPAAKRGGGALAVVQAEG